MFVVRSSAIRSHVSAMLLSMIPMRVVDAPMRWSGIGSTVTRRIVGGKTSVRGLTELFVLLSVLVHPQSGQEHFHEGFFDHRSNHRHQLG